MLNSNNIAVKLLDKWHEEVEGGKHSSSPVSAEAV